MNRFPPSKPDPLILEYRRGTVDALIGEPISVDGYEEVYGGRVVGQTTGALLHYGQSNQANFMFDTYTPTATNSHMMNPFSGGVYRMKEPVMGCNGGLPGGTNTYGCCLSRLGDKLIALGWRTRIVICSVAAGGTTSLQWANGDCTNRLRVAARRMIGRGFAPNIVVRHQGESDTTQGFTPTQVRDNIFAEVAILRAEGVTCPVLCCLVARTNTAAVGTPAYDNVRAGQIAATGLFGNNLGIFAGPDTDQYDSSYRHDDLHWNALGADRFMDELKSYILAFAT